MADRQADRQVGRQAGWGKGEIMIWAEKEKAEEWQHVCTAEHKLKKPRSPSHTPLGPKLHGVLHSTHKQPPGKAPGCMGEAGGRQLARNNNCLFPSVQWLQGTERDCRDKMDTGEPESRPKDSTSPFTKSFYCSVVWNYPCEDFWNNIWFQVSKSYKICV